MSNFIHKYSNNEDLNYLFSELTYKLFQTKLDNLNLFVLNFIIKNSDRISNLEVNPFELSNVNLDFDNNLGIIQNLNDLEKATIYLREKLKEINSDSSIVDITILPEREPSLQAIHRGLSYRGHNDSSYSRIPNTYTIGNY